MFLRFSLSTQSLAFPYFQNCATQKIKYDLFYLKFIHKDPIPTNLRYPTQLDIYAALAGE